MPLGPRFRPKMGRKSLSDWHRVELDEWLRSLIERRIPQVDAEVAERLRVEYRQAIARSMGISVAYLNTSPSTIQKWEQGKKQPNGPLLKLHNIVDQKGLDALG